MIVCRRFPGGELEISGRGVVCNETLYTRSKMSKYNKARQERQSGASGKMIGSFALLA